MAKLDVEMKKSDDLLSQMMPKSVAEKIKVSISFLSFASEFSFFPERSISRGDLRSFRNGDNRLQRHPCLRVIIKRIQSGGLIYGTEFVHQPVYIV